VANHLRPIDVLGDPTRRRIFERLVERPWAVGELARELPVTRPAVSQHLRVLREAGLVHLRVDGTRHIYELDPAGVGELRDWVERFWDAALARYAEAARAAAKEERR
jgi:DNA-binding transcriptional ArsR family regulator